MSEDGGEGPDFDCEDAEESECEPVPGEDTGDKRRDTGRVEETGKDLEEVIKKIVERMSVSALLNNN